MSCSLARALPGNCAQLHDTKLAISSCTEYLNSRPDNRGDEAAAYFYRGTAFGGSEQYDAAIEDLGKAIENAPAWPVPYSDRARTFMSKGETSKAIADLRHPCRVESGQGDRLRRSGIRIHENRRIWITASPTCSRGSN